MSWDPLLQGAGTPRAHVCVLDIRAEGKLPLAGGSRLGALGWVLAQEWGPLPQEVMIPGGRVGRYREPSCSVRLACGPGSPGT